MVSTRNRQAATASPLRAGLEAEPRQKRTTRKDAVKATEASASQAEPKSKPKTKSKTTTTTTTTKKKAAPKSILKKTSATKPGTRAASSQEPQEGEAGSTHDEAVSAVASSQETVEVHDNNQNVSQEDSAPALTPAKSPAKVHWSPQKQVFTIPDKEDLRTPVSHYTAADRFSPLNPVQSPDEAEFFTPPQVASVAAPQLPAGDDDSSSSLSSLSSTETPPSFIGIARPPSRISWVPGWKKRATIHDLREMREKQFASRVNLLEWKASQNFQNLSPSSQSQGSYNFAASEVDREQDPQTDFIGFQIDPSRKEIHLNKPHVKPSASRKTVPSFSAIVKELASDRFIETVSVNLQARYKGFEYCAHNHWVSIPIAALSELAFYWDLMNEPETNCSGTKRKRKDGESEPDMGEPSPAKRVKAFPDRNSKARGVYYDEHGMLVMATEEEKQAGIAQEAAIEKQKREQEELQRKQDELRREQDEIKRERVRQAKARAKRLAEEAAAPADQQDENDSDSDSDDDDEDIDQAAEVSPNEAEATEATSEDEPATPSASRWGFGSIGKLFTTPMGFFRKSNMSAPVRSPIPDFTDPSSDNGSAQSPSQTSSSSVARPLFKTKSPRKKTSKARRQEAITHQEDLVQREDEIARRKAATEAIVKSARSAEDIEAEIQRRVEEELAKAQASQPKKRKRGSSLSDDGPGHTPHASKVGAKFSLEESSTSIQPVQETSSYQLLTPPSAAAAVNPAYMTPTNNSGFGLVYEEIDEDELEEPPAKRAKKSVQFNPRLQSMTTPPSGSDLERIQKNRQPHAEWTASQMFKEYPARGVLKETGYVPPSSYTPLNDDYPETDSEPELEPEPQPPTPHNILTGIPSTDFNFRGSFSAPDFSDDSSDDDDYPNTDGSPGSTPMPKKTTNIFDLARARQDAPPAAPQPAHATLPTSSQATPDKPETSNERLNAARAKAHQFTPKQPSRLKESTNATTSPEPSANGVAIVHVDPYEDADEAVMRALKKQRNVWKDARQFTGQFNWYKEGLHKTYNDTLRTYHSNEGYPETAKVRSSAGRVSNPNWWAQNGQSVIEAVRAGYAEWSQPPSGETDV